MNGRSSAAKIIVFITLLAALNDQFIPTKKKNGNFIKD